MSVDNYANTINICNKELNKRLNKKALWDDDETVSQLFDILYTAYWQQIHKVLVPQENKTAEAEIRSHIRCIISNHLLPLYAKVEKLSKIAKKSPENTKLLNKYMELYDNFYALAAFRSLKHFALYMEFDTDPKDRVWENVMPCFEGLYFYINKMVLDGSIKHICKQYPTGFGKCILETEKAYTPNGYIPLKDLNVGDIVYSLKDNKLVERKITNKWNSRKSQIKITARNGQTIISSPEHHHLTQRGYMRADEITASDYIYEFCAKTDGFVWQKVKSIEAISEEANMVDIEVEETHNFICNGIVTHNSYSDVEAISFIFGINPINNDVMKVVGNPTLVSDVMTGIVNTMSSARYAKVFPYYAQFNGKEEIFSICRISQGNQGILVINGSKRPKSFLCCGKETAIDGGRFKYRFYDDICRSKDKENINEHDKDWARYNDCWKKREYDQYNSFEIAGGTAYSIYDFLSRYKEKFGAKKAVPDTRFKYTYVNENTRFVSVSCPKLDFDTDESTYPAKYSTAEAREERNRDMRTFMAMEQQSPLPPEGTPYYWDNLRLYTDLPAKECNGGTRSDFSWAALDLPRKGNNYAALGIFYRDNKSKDFFFTDCVYEKKPLDGKIADKELLDYICEKMVFHKTTNLVVETNTNSMIVSEIRKRLAALGWSCNIIPQYSYENKEVRIFNTQSAILERIRFPDRKMFPESSNMGQLMRHVVCYAYDGKNDDGIDMISMFAKAFVSNGVKMGAIEVLETRR